MCRAWLDSSTMPAVRTSSLALSLGLLVGCPKAPDSTDPPASTPTVRAGSQTEAQPTAYGGSEEDYSEPFGPNKEPIDITVRNECHRTVRLFFGHQPRPGENYFTTMNGSSQSNVQMMPGDEAWILDDEENPVASTEIDRDSEEIIIDDSCEGIYAR